MDSLEQQLCRQNGQEFLNKHGTIGHQLIPNVFIIKFKEYPWKKKHIFRNKACDKASGSLALAVGSSYHCIAV